jgi:hypothetical protein
MGVENCEPAISLMLFGAVVLAVIEGIIVISNAFDIVDIKCLRSFCWIPENHRTINGQEKGEMFPFLLCDLR